MEKKPGQHWLLWDGDCGFCQACVQWLQRRDHLATLFTVPYQAAPSPPLSDELRQACSQAVHVISADGEVLRGGRATLFCLDQVGWSWIARPCSRPPWIWLVEAGYKLIASQRQRLSRMFFPQAVCAVRSPSDP